MKRFAYYIACCTLVALCACTHDDTDDVIPVGNGKITIQASLDDMAITRATVKDTQAERKITHIDVFAVDENDNIAYYERNTAGNDAEKEDGSGVLTLNVARRAKINDTFVFAQNKEYKFYLVANATATETEMGAIKTLAALQQLVQDDSFIPNTDWASGEQTLLHLTGTTDLGTNPDKKVPETFLMDAVATDAQSNDTWVVNPTDDNLTNLNLSAEFKRAAAKIIVNITQGEDVEFHTKMKDTTGTEETSQYDFIMLPASTFVLPSDEPLVGVKLVNTNPMEPNDQTFVWASKEPAANNSIQVVGYTYAHFWDNANLKNETSLILNIPMMWNKDDSTDNGKEAAAPRSWYKVPLSKDKKFERNKCYVVNVTINAVGASNRSTAIELDDIEYKTLDWVAVDINVGDDENRPAYLELNTDLVEIYNMNFDYTQLEFSSSSYIPNNFANENSSATEKNNIKNNGGIILTDAYYYNYLDQKVELSTTAGDKYKIYADIKSTAEQNVLNGKINIDSPFVGISEQELYEKFGAAPVVPTMPTEPVNPVPTEATYPGTQSEYAVAKSESRPTNPTADPEYFTYQWNNNRFERKTWTYNGKKWIEGKWDDKWDGRKQMLTDYNNAIAAWETWDAWNSLPQSEKNAAIAKYEEDFATYPERLAYYNQQLAAKEEYDENVAEYTAGKVDSHSNAIRYLVFEVYNETGQKATFTVAQYPTLYITNEMGYYSYRSDFGGTTYEKKGNPNYAGATRNDDTGGWTYTRVASNSNMFGSKVAVKDANSNTYSINYYYWSENGNTRNSDGKISSLNNPRMYHVHVTATSSKYTVGKPRLGADGFTEATEENSKLVSPSFMIASQLGASRQVGNSTFAAKHCKEYVEVTTDGTIYDDWRLPTEAEVMIIIEHQYKSDAMAEVLSGKYYYCAWTADGNNYVYNEQSDTEENTKAIRCIRDAY